jgi:hypothetical protein
MYDGFAIPILLPEEGMKTVRKKYGEDENVSVIVTMPLSGDRDWVGIYPVGASNDWENVIAWNWVEEGVTVLSEVRSAMPEGRYEVRLFFHNSFQDEARYAFDVSQNLTEIYGLTGNAEVETTSFEEIEDAVVYHPNTWRINPTPVVFFAPGWQNHDHRHYRTLLRYIASYGYSVVYLPDRGSYASQLKKFVRIAQAYADAFDLTRIGVVGHSSGGGFTFGVLDYLSKSGYGANGRFLMALDPWFAFEMNTEKMRALPSNTNVVIQRYDNTSYTGNETDARITLSEYALLDSIPAERKDYQVYVPATHGYPVGDKAPSKMQGLLKPLDALMRFSFEHVKSARKFALENGSDEPYVDGVEHVREKWRYAYRCDSHVNVAEVMEIDYCNRYLGPKRYPVDTDFDEKDTADVAKPDYLSHYVDPVFGNEVTRITNRALQDNNEKPHSTTQVWNANNTLIRLGYRIYDANDFTETEITKNHTIRETMHEIKWSSFEPNVFYGIDERDDRFVFVRAIVDIQNGTIEYRDLPDAVFMKSEYDELTMGKGGGNLDYQDNYVVFAGRKKDTNRVTLILYHLQNNYGTRFYKTESTVTTSMKWYVEDENGNFSTDTSEENQMFRWASISALGHRVVVCYRTENNDAQQNTIELYDKRFNHLRRIAEQGYTGDLGVNADGKEVYVQFGFGTVEGEDNRGIWLYRLDDSVSKLRLLPDNYEGGSVSCRNFKRPGWCYLDTRYQRNGKGVREVFALKLDGSQTVERFAQTHSSDENALYVRVNVNPDGTRVLFDSDWGDTNATIDTYHVKVGE